MTRCVLVGLALIAAPALADDENARFAETASEIARAIQQGRSLEQIDRFPRLSRPEREEVARLAGCDGALRSGGGEAVVQIDWSCGPDTAHPGLSRTVAIVFDSDQRLEGFAINPITAEFEPLAEARAERPLRLAAKLGESVTAGEVEAFAALVPLDEFQRARLAEFEGGSFIVSRLRRDYVPILFDDAARAESLLAYVHFEGGRRASGVTFAPTLTDPVTPQGREARLEERQKRMLDRQERNRRAIRRRRGIGSDAGMGERTREACPTC